MSRPTSFYEIELKALLSKEKHDRLYNRLPKKMKLINEETIHTTRYRPGDIRLRHSIKTTEIVCKEGDPTKISRKEVKIPLVSKDRLNYFAQIFELLNLQPDPPWTKHKREFEYKFNGHTYIVCIQNIENFAYILEVEHISKTNDVKTHEPNIRAILKQLGCKPIEPKDFLGRIQSYIKANRYRKRQY